MLSRFDRWLTALENAFANIALVGIVFLIAAVCSEMIMRNVFDRPLSWVIEISEYTMLYITFLGTSAVLRQGRHVSVDLLTEALNDTWRRRLAVVSSSICLVSVVALTWFGTLATIDAQQRGVYKPTLMEFPTWIVLAVIPVGSMLLSLRFTHRLLAQLKGATAAKLE